MALPPHKTIIMTIWIFKELYTFDMDDYCHALFGFSPEALVFSSYREVIYVWLSKSIKDSDDLNSEIKTCPFHKSDFARNMMIKCDVIMCPIKKSSLWRRFDLSLLQFQPMLTDIVF